MPRIIPFACQQDKLALINNMFKKILKKLFFSVFLPSFFFLHYSLFISFAHAADVQTDVGAVSGGSDALQTYIEKLYNNYLLTIGSALTLIMIIWAGFEYITSSGNPEQVESAKKKLVYTLSGYILLLLVGVIYKFLVEPITK